MPRLSKGDCQAKSLSAARETARALFILESAVVVLLPFFRAPAAGSTLVLQYNASVTLEKSPVDPLWIPLELEHKLGVSSGDSQGTHYSVTPALWRGRWDKGGGGGRTTSNYESPDSCDTETLIYSPASAGCESARGNHFSLLIALSLSLGWATNGQSILVGWGERGRQKMLLSR